MKKSFRLDIITPEDRVFSEEIEMVSVPTVDGQIGVLADHVPLFTALTEGEVKVQGKSREYYLAIGGGFMEVTDDGASILVSRAMHAHDLNDTEIRKAMDSARKILAGEAKGLERAEAMAILRRSLIEQRIMRKRRTVRRSPSRTH